MNYKSKYLSSAFLLLLTSIIVKVIGAVYKIPLTASIGAVGRGYFATAYNIYLPIHAVIMGAFPITLSRITGKYNALENREALVSLKKGADKLFFAVGIIGMSAVLLLSKPYCDLIASSPKSIYSVLALAPSILFSALAASYRGYYEGFLNMTPTSVSQTVEALTKMIFGLIFARLAMARLYSIYLSTGTVLGKCAASEEEAFSLIYPVTSAAAMLGVTFGCVISLVYVVIYHRINKPEYFDLRAKNTGRYKSELLSFSFPIMVSCAVQSIFQFLDTASVQAALSLIKTEDLKNAYIESISLANTADGDIITYVYGLLSSAVDFKNLIPGITMALGVCAVPAISAACSSKNNEQLALLINSVFKYTSVISMGGGIIIALCSEDILKLFYSASSPDIIAGCSALVRCFGLTAFFYSLAGTAVFCVQALGFPKKSIAPYIVSGIIRVILNILLVSNEDFILFGSVISGAAGYFVMLIWNTAIIKKQTAVKIKSRDAYIKPVFVSILSYFLLKFVFEKINFLSTAPINLLIKTALSGLIYCILCFLFKLLNFKEIFCVLKSKKMA